MARSVEDRSSFIAADSWALSGPARWGLVGLTTCSSSAPAPADRLGRNVKDHGSFRVNVFIGQILGGRFAALHKDNRAEVDKNKIIFSNT